jgi:hypothetical protein
MQQAKAGSRLITAGPDLPEAARCLVCEAPVRRRKRRVHNGRPTFFYRHDARQRSPPAVTAWPRGFGPTVCRVSLASIVDVHEIVSEVNFKEHDR